MPKFLGIGLVVLALLCVSAPARADRVTRSEKALTDGIAAECRRLGQCASLPSVDAYQASWVHRALTRQRRLDDSVPFNRELWPHTHNTFNSSVYPLTLTDMDPNQLYTIRDQLRMDIRAIELDVHKWQSLDKPLDDDVVLCHGQEVALGPVIYHLGCSVDRPFVDGLSELRGWLSEPGNHDEVVLLYLENNLDGDLAAHTRAAADIQSVLGDLVYRPPAAKPCAPMPMQLSRADVRAAGKRVLIVGNCGPGAWGTWVHERGPQWDESSSPEGDDYPDLPACRKNNTGHLVRWYEDSTWLTAMADGSESQLTLTETQRMVRCGVNLVGFDQLRPDDPRLAALVWSWAPGEPRAGAGSCAAQGPDARFHARRCSDPMPLACQSVTNTWSVASRRCPRHTRFATPANGYENQLLRQAKLRAHVPWARLNTPL